MHILSTAKLTMQMMSFVVKRHFVEEMYSTNCVRGDGMTDPSAGRLPQCHCLHYVLRGRMDTSKYFALAYPFSVERQTGDETSEEPSIDERIFQQDLKLYMSVSSQEAATAGRTYCG